MNGTLFFHAVDGVHGDELWKSDGTAAGTVLVKDVDPGGSGSYLEYVTNVNGTVFFVPEEGFNGVELWKTDGTEAGTVLVKDIRPGSSSSQPRGLTNVNGTLYFFADDGTNGEELWKSDGTEAGTVMVKDINAGSADSSSGVPTLVNLNGTLLFPANDGNGGGRELWKSDGTEAGTVLVSDVYPFTRYGALNNLEIVNGTLFFFGQDGTGNKALWKSDGTTAGTVLVKDVDPPTALYTLDLENANGTLFFSASDGAKGYELWKSDGTEAGTVLVKDIAPGFNGSNPRNLTEVNGTLFFSADNGTTGIELWKSDGTEAGTVLVKDVQPINASGGNYDSNPNYFTNVAGMLFFSADDGTNGYELWQSDGTTAGTVRLEINPGSGNSYPNSLLEVNGKLLFRADDGVHGEELWANLPPLPFPADAFVSGAVDGSLQIIDAATGAVARSGLRPLDGASPYAGLLQVALGDMSGDGTPDVFVSAANPSGAAGLDPSKAGKVFVYDGDAAVNGTLTLIRTFTPFATTDGPAGNTLPYVNGLNIAVGDVNGDGTIDLVAGTRGGNGTATGGNREVGRLVVIDGASPAGQNTVIGGIQKPFGGGYEKGVVVAAGNADGVGGDEVAVTRGGPVASTNPAVQRIKVKVLQLRSGALAELPLNADGTTSFAPFAALTGAANAIKRDGRVAFVDRDGDGKAELVFSALDPLTNPANGQVRVSVFSIGTAATAGPRRSSGPARTGAPT